MNVGFLKDDFVFRDFPFGFPKFLRLLIFQDMMIYGGYFVGEEVD